MTSDISHSDELITEPLVLGSRALVVSEATYMMGIRRGNIIGEYIDDIHMDEVTRNVLTGIYAPLAACTSGDVPTAEEFLGMRETDIEHWIETAKKLNPAWFAWLDEAAKAVGEAVGKLSEAEKKKKEKKPARSPKS